jgi:hypothetical protein
LVKIYTAPNLGRRFHVSLANASRLGIGGPAIIRLSVENWAIDPSQRLETDSQMGVVAGKLTLPEVFGDNCLKYESNMDINILCT